MAVFHDLLDGIRPPYPEGLVVWQADINSLAETPNLIMPEVAD